MSSGRIVLNTVMHEDHVTNNSMPFVLLSLPLQKLTPRMLKRKVIGTSKKLMLLFVETSLNMLYSRVLLGGKNSAR